MLPLCLPSADPAPILHCAGGKQLQSAMDKMRNMAVKRDSLRNAAESIKPAADTDVGDDLSAYL